MQALPIFLKLLPADADGAVHTTPAAKAAAAPPTVATNTFLVPNVVVWWRRDWLKNILEDGTQLKLLQPTDDFVERLHRQQPLAQAPL
jgi:hypothetical protein